jgi:hypothetical protein
MCLPTGEDQTDRQSKREGSRFRHLMAAQLLVEKASAASVGAPDEASTKEEADEAEEVLSHPPASASA